jgi:putative transposase
LRLPTYTSPGAYFITICTHRRECLFGAVVNGEKQLNALGEMVDACWQRLPLHRPNLTLDAFVVMPNHVHGILILSHPSGRGAALGQGLVDLAVDSCPNATPSHRCEPGVAGEREMVEKDQNLLPHAAPLPLALVSGSVGAIVLNFKSVTTRTRNRVARSPGNPVWQRNYYVRVASPSPKEIHIIRNEESLQRLRQYIHTNPLSWQEDQLHPDMPSKW